MSKFHRLLTSKNRCLSYDLGQPIENINRSIAYTNTHITTFYAWLDFAPSYIYACIKFTHGVLHDTVFDTESGEGGGQAAESLNLPYLDVIQIVSHDVYSTWIAKSEIHESVAVLVRPDGYVVWRYRIVPMISLIMKIR